MKNIRFYTIAVLFDKLPTPKVNRCLHMDIWYSTFDIGSHVMSCLREYYIIFKDNLSRDFRYQISNWLWVYQDLPGSIHEDTVMDGHRQEKEANAYKYPLAFLKWWSSLVLKTFTVSAETIPSPNLFHSSQTLLANLDFPTSKRYLFFWSRKSMYPSLQEQNERSEIDGLWCNGACIGQYEEVWGIRWKKRWG